jgi:hypothetical protein
MWKTPISLLDVDDEADAVPEVCRLDPKPDVSRDRVYYIPLETAKLDTTLNSLGGYSLLQVPFFGGRILGIYRFRNGRLIPRRAQKSE